MVRKNIPVKTKEGTQEIRARSLGLAPRIRTALLLVDGIKSVTELENLMAAAGVTPGALQMLLDKGLIRFADEDANTMMTAVTAYHAAPTILDVDPHELQEATPEAVEPSPAAAPYFAPTLLEVPQPKPTQQKPAQQEPAQQKPAENKPAQEKVVLQPVPSLPAAKAPQQSGKVDKVDLADKKVEPMMVPLQRPAPVAQNVPPRLLSAPLEVVTLLELETILGEATKMEVATLLGVATMLELTPTQLMAPRTAVKVPPPEPARLPPLAQAERQHRAAVEAAPKLVLPAAVLRMNLMAAKAHLASALDLYLEMDGYLLKQKVMACEVREELEQLFDPVEAALSRKLNGPTVASMIATAHVILDR